MYNSIKNNSLPRFLNLVFSLLLISSLAACSGGGNPGPAVNIASASMAEGNTGSSNLSFTITLAEAADGATSVNYATSDGTAVAGQDYTAAFGTVTIPAGSTSATVDISINGDKTYEADETFTVTLSSPSGLTLGSSSSATGTIANDDDADPKGYYTGTATINTSTTISDLIGLVYNKRLLLFSRTGASNVLYDVDLGTITGHTNFSGTVNVYVNGGNPPISATVTGTTNDSQITGTFGGTGFASGTFDILFDTSNNRPATLARINTITKGNWNGSIYGIDQDSGSFATNTTDVYSGVDNTTQNCAYLGNLVIPDASVNIYELSHDIFDQGGGTCNSPYASTGHTGFAAVIDTADTDDTLVYAFTNGTIALFAVMSH